MNITWRKSALNVREEMTPYLPVASTLLGVIGVVGAIAIGILTGSFLGSAAFGAVFLITGVLLLRLRDTKSQVEAAQVKRVVIGKAEANKRVDEEKDLSPAARDLLLNYVRYRRSWPPEEFKRHLELATEHSLNPEAALARDNPISWILAFQEHMKTLGNQVSDPLKNEVILLSSFSYQNLEEDGKEAKESLTQLTVS